jgi:hypothetical protein
MPLFVGKGEVNLKPHRFQNECDNFDENRLTADTHQA